MTIRVLVNKDEQKVMLDVGERREAHEGAIEEALHTLGKLCVDYTRYIIKTGEKTGIHYKRLPNRSSAEFQAPADQSGDLAASVSYVVNGAEEMEFGDTIEYGKYLEFGTRNKDGTSRMRPRPHLLVTANEKANDAVNIIYDCTKRRINKKATP